MHNRIFIVWVLFSLNFVNARPQMMNSQIATWDRYPKDLITTKERILNTSRMRISEASQQEIIFPDSYEATFEPFPKIDGPPKCADGSTFCEDFDAYPYSHVKSVLEQNPLYKNLFGEDEAPVEISNRVSGDIDTFVCNSIQKTIFPKVGKNKDSVWKFIVNQEDQDGYVQGVRIETCRSYGSPCDLIGELPNGYITTCKQKYVYRRLLSLSDSGAPAADSFQLPSACCCSYKRSVDFLARFGSLFTPAKVKR